VEEALADPEDHPGPVRGLRHLDTVRDAVRDRLLARHVLAGRDRGEHVLLVEMRRGQDLDRVDVRVGEEVLKPGVHGRDAPFGRHLARLVLPGVAERHDVAAGISQVAGHVHGRDVADADDADPDPVHGVTSHDECRSQYGLAGRQGATP